MKKLTSLLLALLMMLSLTACGAGEEEKEEEEEEIVGGIKITTENFRDYIFVYGVYMRRRGGYYTGTINFKAHPDSDCVPGTFHNVKAVVRPSDIHWKGDWHIVGDDKSYLEISFELDINGKFSQEYEIEDTYGGRYRPEHYTDDWSTETVSFDVVSVSGTFVPDDVSAAASSSAG